MTWGNVNVYSLHNILNDFYLTNYWSVEILLVHKSYRLEAKRGQLLGLREKNEKRTYLYSSMYLGLCEYTTSILLEGLLLVIVFSFLFASGEASSTSLYCHRLLRSVKM